MGEGSWVVIMDSASVALRSIDHLLPQKQNPSVAFQAPTVDFYWTPTTPGGPHASRGLWAVRRQYLVSVLDGWFALPTVEANQLALAWANYVAGLPHKKKRLEVGEVATPVEGTLDWVSVRKSAFVTIPDWPPEEKWPLLQALYLGAWFGDGTGFLLDGLDP